jgi:STE20-like kinase
MPFFSNLKKVLNNFGAGDGGKKKKPNLEHISVDQDPEEFWEIVGDLGDGAFGKVHKVRHKQKPDLLAAGKICVLENEDELDDFMVEIDILAEVQHENVLELYEAYFFQNRLWVSEIV